MRLPILPRCAACLFLCFLLAACAGIQYTDQPTAVVLEPGQGASTRVLAKAGEWRVSGASLVKGQTYTVSAQGRWSAGPICGLTGPDGVGASGLCLSETPGWSGSTLMARIAESGPPFGVGASYTFQAEQDGVLLFKINDPAGLSGDNDGYVDVTVRLLGTGGVPALAAPSVVPVSPAFGAPGARAKKAFSSPGAAQAQPPFAQPSQPAPVAASMPEFQIPEPLPPAAQAYQPPTAKPGLRRVALVIGNGAYSSAPLRNPVNDARDMAAALRSLGFEVILRENASLRQMEDAVDLLWQRLKAGGAGLFFFAGHGLQVGGRNYLVPVDARLAAEQDVKYRCMDAGLVLGRMENAGNSLNIVILDACRNNPYSRSFRTAQEGLAKMDAPKGSLVAYATAPDSVAADGHGKNGIYTGQLLRHLRTPGLGIEELFKRVRIGVLGETGEKQVPWESSSLTGYFTFNEAGR